MIIYYIVGFATVGVAAMDQLARRTTKKLRTASSYAISRPWPQNRGASAQPKTKTSRRDKPASAFALAIAGAILIAFAGLRYSIGTDYVLYEALYSQIDANSLSNSVEQVPQDLGYVVLSVALKKLSVNPYILFWTSSVLTIAPLMVAIWRKSKNPALSLFVYYFLGLYVLSFNAIRQSIAVSFLLLADTYRETSRTKWLLFSAIAAFFHISAVVVIVVQIASAFWVPTRKSAVLVLILSGVVAATLLRTNFAYDIAGALNGRYEVHLAADQGAGFGTALTLIFRIALLLLLLQLAKSNSDRRHLAFVTLSAVILIFTLSNSLIGRFDSYFLVFLVLLIPSALSGEGSKRWHHVVIYSSLAIYLGFYVQNYNAVSPYIWIPELGGG